MIRLLALLALSATAAQASPYAWLPPGAAVDALVDRFPTPAGFERVAAPAGSYAAWLRTLPVDRERTQVRAFDGRPLLRPAAALIALDVGERDLQQCADTALRLHAEYLWSRGLGLKAAYHFTSGDRSSFADWVAGERFAVQGARVKRSRGKARGRGHATYREWLMHLFRYAGTRSLALDSVAVGDRPLEPGDFFVQPGGPGHAVVLLDVATHPDGRRVALIGQGFMPAEDLHVLIAAGPSDVGGVWFRLPDAAHPELDTPSWAPFKRAEARRFKTP